MEKSRVKIVELYSGASILKSKREKESRRERPSVISGKTAKKCGRRRRRLLKKQGNRKLNLNIFPLQKPGKSANTA